MRLIDGDALKIALDTFATIVGFGGVYGRGQVMECINAAETADQWISVKERLPEDNGAYLVYTQEEYIGLFWFDRDEKEWTEESDFPCLEGYVTHWMPLSEPPKKDQ